MFLSLFNSFASAKSPPDIVSLQDPPVWRSRLPSFQGFTCFSPPSVGGKKPRVACYVSRKNLVDSIVLPGFFNSPDVMALNIYGEDLFGGAFSS